MKPERKKWPTLAAYWDGYGHIIPWEKIYDMKVASHGCVAIAWQERDGLINYATIARLGDHEWDMQNDSHSDITEAQWKAARFKPQCDWLWFPKTGEDL